jgi:pimeloyl-ACP methyl ester carboxylesterase
MNTESKFFEADGIKLHYLILGQGKPLLFLHGVGVSTLSYRHVLDLLATKFTVYAPDIPGFGKSSVPQTIWSYEDYAKFLNKFAADLKLQNLILVGHSFGGEIALRMAKKNAEISKLVLIAATGSPVIHSIPKLLYIILFKKHRANLKAYQDPQRLNLIQNDYLSNIRRKFSQSITLARIILRSIYSSVILEEKLPTETLILWSEKDEILDYESINKLSQKLGPHTIKKLDEHHDWLLFKPELLMEELGKLGL